MFTRSCMAVEHGTPRRAFARKILDLSERNDLNATTIIGLVERYDRLAVKSLEDRHLNAIARSKMFNAPAAAAHSDDRR